MTGEDVRCLWDRKTYRDGKSKGTRNCTCHLMHGEGKSIAHDETLCMGMGSVEPWEMWLSPDAWGREVYVTGT